MEKTIQSNHRVGRISLRSSAIILATSLMSQTGMAQPSLNFQCFYSDDSAEPPIHSHAEVAEVEGTYSVNFSDNFLWGKGTCVRTESGLDCRGRWGLTEDGETTTVTFTMDNMEVKNVTLTRSQIYGGATISFPCESRH